MNDKNYYIYGLFAPKEELLDECFYIGKGCDGRLFEHFSNSSKEGVNPHKDNKIEKIEEEGKEPYAKKIISGLEESKAYELEEFLIEEIGLENLTNLTSGGRGAKSGENHPMFGQNHSKESRRKMSEARKGYSFSKETLQKLSEKQSGERHPMYGKEHTEKTKEKMSKAKKDNYSGEGHPQSKLSREQAQEIKWLTLNSDLTHKKIADKYNISRSQVSSIKNSYSWPNIEPKRNK